MALNGSVSTNSGEDGRYYRLDWEVKTGDQSIVDCSSKITYYLYSCGKPGGWVAERTLYAIIDGTYVVNKSTRVERWDGLIASGTTTLYHDASTGKRSFTVSLGAAVYLTTVTCTGSGSFTLDPISRGSTMTVSDGTLDVEQTISLDNHGVSSYTHTLTWVSGSYNGTIATGDAATQFIFKPALELANGAPNGTRVYCELTLNTHNGDTLIGTTTKAIYLAIPESIIPECSIRITDVDGHLATYGGYIQGHSRINVTNVPVTKYSSPIEAYAIAIEGKLYSDSFLENVVLSSSGTVPIKAQVRDTRGRFSDHMQVDVNVLPYSEPRITSLSVHRCKQNGEDDVSGSYVRVTYSTSISPLNNANSKTLQLKYKKTTDIVFTTVDLDGVYAADNVSTIIPADDGSPYEIQLHVSDSFTETPVSVRTFVSTGYTIAHVTADGKNLAIGKVSEGKGFEVAMGSHFYKGLTMDIQTLYEGDCDAILDSGQYYIGTSGTHKPGDGLNGWLTVQAYGSDKEFCHQTYVTYTGIEYRRFRQDGVWGDWIREKIIAYGASCVTPSAANTPTSIQLDFGITFPSPPKVVVTPKTTVPGTMVLGMGVTDVTVEGCKVYLTRTTTTPTDFMWIAVL